MSKRIFLIINRTAGFTPISIRTRGLVAKIYLLSSLRIEIPAFGDLRAGEITFANAPRMQITKGDALVTPHAEGKFTISGANVIVCRPHIAELAKTAP